MLANERNADNCRRGVEPVDNAALLDLTSELIQICTPSGLIQYTNRAWREALGYSDQDVQSRLVLDIVRPDHEQALSETMREVCQRQGVRAFESVLMTRHGEPVQVSGWMDCRFDGDSPILVRTVMRDTRLLHEEKAKLLDAQTLFRTAFDSPAIGMAVQGLDGRWHDVNDALSEMLGYSHTELLHMTFHDITHADDLAQQIELTERLLHGDGQHFQMEKRYIHRDGSIVTAVLTVSVVTDQTGAPIRLVSQVQDITARRQLETQLLHRASHDVLTGLPNRALFVDRLEHALSRGQRDGDQVAVMFLDLDGFKAVNDQFGHDQGDRLLVEVGKRLRACARAADTVARLGGDEFTILLEDIRHPSIAIEVAQRVRETLRYPFILGDHVTTISPSIGIAISNGSDDRADRLLHAADTAMYDAKRAGKDRAVVAGRGIQD